MTDPGGYIGEAMAAARRPRKPAPLYASHILIAWINFDGHVQMSVAEFGENVSRRLSAWLTRAAAWMEARND
jgi:hypothetical protein